MKQPRLPNPQSDRISVEAPEAKKKLVLITDVTGETLKEAVIRIVDEEYKKICRKEDIKND